MSREFPDWVNPWKAAEGNRIFSGTIALDRMSRLKSLLADSAGEAKFLARFSLDPRKRALIDLEVEAELPLTCQATLEQYRERVVRRSLLAVVDGPEGQEMLPEDYEPTATDSGRLVFAGLVEDELLLALPQVPRKPGLEGLTFSTDPDAAADTEVRSSPFSELEDLMQGVREDPGKKQN